MVSNVSGRGEYLPRIDTRYKENDRPFTSDPYEVSKMKGGGSHIPRIRIAWSDDRQLAAHKELNPTYRENRVKSELSNVRGIESRLYCNVWNIGLADDESLVRMLVVIFLWLFLTVQDKFRYYPLGREIGAFLQPVGCD